MKLRSPSRKSSRSDQGYVLITLILFIAILTIAAVAIVPTITFQIKRDREQELIHRGVQYSRAIKHYVKKFGRYPTRMEDLENTNQVRFLRKRYKDPITGQDFKLLHMGEVQMAFGAGIAGATSVTAMAAGAAGAAAAQQGPAGLQALAAFQNNLANGGSATAVAGAGGLGNQTTTNQAGGIVSTPVVGAAGQNVQAGDTEGEGEGQTQPGTTPAAGQGGTFAAAGPAVPGAGSNQFGTTPNGQQVFGGGPVVGVVSTSKDKSIRVFNKKDHYNQWQFIYDPASDTGGLLSTPNQPPLMQAQSVQQQNAAGQQGTGTNPGGFGNTGFSNTGFSNQPGPGSQPNQPLQPNMPPEQGPQ